MRWLAVIAFCLTLAVPVYNAGYNSAQRECPPAQQDQRLLRSEQMPSGLLCYYASGWDGYGHRVTSKKVHARNAQ